LATFRQNQTNDDGQFFENIPLPILRGNAILASVNVYPNAQGQVEYYGYAEKTAGAIRPSLGVLINGSQGRLGDEFRIDQSIRPSSFSRISAIDILSGSFDPNLFDGRVALIGATAIELRDYYETAGHGILPGVYIHAMAAETLKNGKDVPHISSWFAFAIAFLTIFLTLAVRRANRQLRRSLVLPAILSSTLLAISLIAYSAGLAHIPIGAGLIFIFSYLVSVITLKAIRNMRVERQSDATTRLPNVVALERFATRIRRPGVAIAQIANYREISAIYSEAELVEFTKSIVERLKMLTHGQTVFRTSGDQLAWVVPKENLAALSDYFETVSAFFLTPLTVGTQKVRLKIHCGFYQDDRSNWDQILPNAALAAYKAADMGYRWLPFSSGINTTALEKITMLSDVDQAMENGDIWVAYQPKMDVKSGEITSAEALARWQHPTLGNITPDRFIPVLEDDNRITDLTLYVLRRTLEDLVNWQALGFHRSCSINVSAGLLENQNFVSDAIAIVESAAVRNEQIGFEITETASISNLDDVGRILQIIRDKGIRISIDDYGTGQSTLSYLRDFPADEIKIDQTFVKFMTKNEIDRVMVGSTIELAHQMNFKVVAEGVEDAKTLEMLVDQGCDIVQGWHIGKPVDADQFAAQWLVQTYRDVAV